MAYVIHPASKKLLETTAEALPGSLLLYGPDGIGLAGALELIRGDREVVEIKPEKDGAIDLEKGSISVEMVRGLYDLVRGRATKARVIVLRDADRMSIGAQNAFLKLLEEPSDSTHFVLFAHNKNSLLATIRSRVQAIELRRISTDESESLLDSLNVTDATVRSQLLFIAGGLPALLTRLATDTTLFESRAQIVRDARTILTETPYQRLLIAERYKERREETLILLTDMAKLLKRSPENGSIARIGDILKTYDRIVQNGNIRMQLAALVV